jgi:hypothetical protein
MVPPSGLFRCQPLEPGGLGTRLIPDANLGCVPGERNGQRRSKDRVSPSQPIRRLNRSGLTNAVNTVDEQGARVQDQDGLASFGADAVE